MRVLAFDTCFGACSAAIADNGVIVAHRLAAIDRGHAERLLPMIAECLAEVGIGMGSIDLIAVTYGPGTFVGTRVGVAAARGLALATGLPVTGASSLAVMAAAMATDGPAEEASIRAVAVDAGRDMLYVAHFGAGSTAEMNRPRLAGSIDAARLPPAGVAVSAAGSGARAYAAAAARLGRAIALDTRADYPDARALALMASALPRLDPVRPLYLRQPDARPQVPVMMIGSAPA